MIVLGGAAALQAGGLLPNLGPATATDDAQYARQSEVASLNDEIAGLRQALQETSNTAAASPSGSDNAAEEALTALGQRLDALEKAGASSADSAAALQSTQDSVTALQQSVDKAGQTAAAAQEAASGAQNTADDAAAAATAAQQAADRNGQSLKEAQAGLGEVRDALGTVTNRLSNVEASNQEARVALAAANLKAAIDSGGPFMSQLETYARTADDSQTTDQLRGFAADGVPSEQALADRWPEVRENVSTALTPTAPDAPVSDQFMSGLKSLVQVRPSGPAPASAQGPDAALSRMDAAIDSGDLAAWQTEWQSLPAPAKAASRDFADDVEARLAAEDAVSGALSAALQTSGSSTPASGSEGAAGQGEGSSPAPDGQPDGGAASPGGDQAPQGTQG